MKTNILSFLVVVSFLFMSCSKDECEELYNEGCVTTQDYTPVCGCNGKTYANKSIAECAQVSYTEGACQ